MAKNDLLNQYTWVMKVLESCQNEAQVKTTEKLFELYVKKWDNNLTDQQITTLSSNFEKEKKSKLYKTRKRKGTFLSTVSQFFLF
jgi:hypothetical protein